MERMDQARQKFMQAAVDLAAKGMREGSGGPFGAVVVKGNEIVGRGYNCVTSTNDPTAHAEVLAIRDACRLLGTFQLGGCEIYTSSEPCPMCLGAIYWARPDRVYYANTREDAAAASFDDSLIYREINKPVSERSIPMERLDSAEALRLFDEWKRKINKTLY